MPVGRAVASHLPNPRFHRRFVFLPYEINVAPDENDRSQQLHEKIGDLELSMAHPLRDHPNTQGAYMFVVNSALS